MARAKFRCHRSHWKRSSWLWEGRSDEKNQHGLSAALEISLHPDWFGAIREPVCSALKHDVLAVYRDLLRPNAAFLRFYQGDTAGLRGAASATQGCGRKLAVRGGCLPV